jgi:ATP-dependent DNA ligase
LIWITAPARKAADVYLDRMPSTFNFCLPTRSTAVPATTDWLHEIKYDGYRLRVERDGDRVRLYTLAVTFQTHGRGALVGRTGQI